MKQANRLTKTVWILSWVSLFTDFASEMLYPIMPVYLSSIGFTVFTIGILEGLAEAIAGLSKSYFGKWSDSIERRLPFVQIGYALSAISKPLLGLFTQVAWVFSARTLDRLGKGIRTGARDAMLSDETTETNKGTVFGFHRSMDTMGAVLGPVGALLFLYFFPEKYTALFILAFIPGLIAITFTFQIKEKKIIPSQKKHAVGFFSSFKYWKQSSSSYRKLVVALILFSLFNSSDMLLLLKIKQLGFNDTWIIGLYIFYNLIFALLAYPVGIIADRIGLKKILTLGLILFTITYIGFSFNEWALGFIVLFFIYGTYAAATDGIAKAWISSLVLKTDKAVAMGMYAGLQSISALIASSVAGLLWYKFGAEVSFLLTAGVSLLVALYIGLILKI